MNIENYQINSISDIKYTSLLNTHCVYDKRFIYVYMLEEHLQRYIETGKSIFKIGQTDVKVGNRIADQIYHHNWQTITSSAPIIIAIYEVDSNITDKMIQSRICSLVNNATISKYSEKKSYQFARPGTEWVDNITISDIENAINYYNGNFMFINSNALDNKYEIESENIDSKYEFVNMLNHLANSYDNKKEKDTIKHYLQGIAIISIILGEDYKKCNVLFGHYKFIKMIEDLFKINYDEFINKISYYKDNYSDIDSMISLVHEYAKDNDLDMSWIAECFLDFSNNDKNSEFTTNWKRMAAYYYADYLQEYIDKMDFDCQKNKDIKFLIYPGSLAIIDLVADYRKVAIKKYNKKSEKIRYTIENEMHLAFDYSDDFIANFVKQVIYYKYNIKFNNIIYINEKQEIYNNKKELIDMPKFDYIVQNPPYSGDLHLDFLKMGLNMLNEKGQMVIIEPATWLINLRNNGNVKRYNEIKNFLTNIVKSVTIASLNKKFNTGLYVPFSITHIDKSNNYDKIFFKCYDAGKFVNSLYDCNLIGNKNIINDINNKVLSKCKERLSDYKFDNNKIYTDATAFVRYTPLITLHEYKLNSSDKFYDDVNNMYYNQSYAVYGAHKHDYIPVNRNNIGTSKSKNNNIWECIYCDKFDKFEDNKKFLDNFVDFTKHCKFAHYLGMVYIISQHNMVLPYVPYLDFSHKWTDEMINEYFEFNMDEINLINNTCDKFEWHSDWYQKFREYKEDI